MTQEVLKLALEQRITDYLSAGGLFNPEFADHVAVRDLLIDCRKVLAQPEQEPVAWMHVQGNFEEPSFRKLDAFEINRGWTQYPLYPTPPQRKPLPPQSPCEMTQAEGKMFKLGWLECEAAHGIKGEA